ncbi:mediator of RNA polymerase II transcription subunit 13-like [Chenopodium quinoa]|uniref:mediator of RNA polymerase II transcription subunit 13-like n=1 Tax=Chenopodium quinoa TaxID=63459 RepID=UPI000B78A31F|nr:mediator of RNA polymerase II transcription subunit 13-like [Chenopodium quinoa]XP_021714942.1 mediator of RNA polymerase II transcription subunit 13-like [Chenopodium quinoa]
MWTNIFRIGGLHQLSWFQFLPNESDVTCLPDKSSRTEQRDAATLELISSHVQLQKDGFLSTWTNSFVGPWDPSQGTHNPDEKIKLWLFLPGRHSSVSETAQPAVCKLRVVASGLWISPGDSEEVATALSQALKSRLERALIGLSYVRYGDVFSRYRPFSQSEELFRKGQPTIEFVFAASEDAIFVHAILSAKHVRTLSGGDMEKVLKLSSSSLGQRLPVVVSPHGMCGKVTGCCSSDLVKQVFVGPGASNTSTGLVGLPYTAAHTSGGKLGGQNYYLEVTLGCSSSGSEKVNLPNSNINSSNRPTSGSPSIAKGSQKVSTGDASNFEKTFIYPSEAVLVPILQTSYARSFLKRFWLPNWTGLSLAGSTLLMHCCGSETDDVDDSWSESDGISLQHGLHSSSNSNNSSISSISSSSSDSDCRAKATSGDLEGDADSLTGRQSGLSSVDPMDTNGPKQGAKRPRTGADDSYIQAGTVGNAPKHEYSNSGIPGVTNDHAGSEWDWDDDDRGGGMDIQALLSEFGDFGDFFENDALPFGEPPGTAESQALVYSGHDCGDGGGSPSGTLMDVPDPMLLPASFQMFESLHSPSTGMEECVSNIQEATKCNSTGLVSCAPAASNGEIDHVLKAEALLTFAPEYGAVETPSSELSSTVFRSPYQPKSQKAESLNSSGSNYVYGATPPSSPGTNGREENPSLAADSRIHPGKYDIGSDLQKLYTQIERGQTLTETMSIKNSTVTSSEGASLSLFSGFNSSSTVKSVQDMTNEVANSAKQFFLSQRTVPSVELECLMFQAFMCRIRHTLLPFGNPASTAGNRSIGNMGLGQLPGDPSGTPDNFSSKSELRKKDSIPVRIAGDFDGGMLDSPFNAPIGVWRSVATSKPAKPAITPTAEVFPSSSQQIFNEEAMISYRKRQPLQDFLDAMPLLVQQAVSFVDVAFDGEFVDGPYSWLALQEQCRRGFCCGPHMAHAGCGGIFASCHSFDIAGVDLLDPVSADVQASSVISLLQSDVKTALKSAFGSSDGPLFVTDWCKGRSLSADAGTTSETLSAESTLSEYRDSSNTTALSVSDPVSPSQSTAGMPSGLRDGSKADDTGHKRSNQELCMSESEPQLRSRRRPSLLVIPSTSILVGYQDDWLKTSASSLQLWEKAPLEPYAFQKHVSYYAVCPNINSLTMMAADFFQELGSVYEMCKLGSHSPHAVGNQMDVDSGKCLTSGFVLLDIPQSVKVESTNASGIGIGSISDFYQSLSSSWDIASYLRSLAKALKTLQLGSCSAANAKEGNNSSCTVIYVVCPFPDPIAVLQTIVESSVAVASVFFSTENDKRAILHSQVGKALNHAAGVDEVSISNIPTLSGFSIPRIVLQIVPIDAIFRVSSPSLNELVLFKEIAFTVYNKARRILRGSSNEFIQPSTFSGRSSSMLVNMANPIPGMWKDCVGSRFSGSSLSREGEFDPGMRAGTWDNSWQTARAGGLSCDANRSGDALFQEQAHYMFEPLFIMAEPGSAEHGVSPTPIGNVATDDSSGGFAQNSTLCGDTVPSSQLDGSEGDSYGSGLLRSSPSLHCCYGWTEDWRWLVCIWTDSRGELLDNHIFPFGGISSRQDTKGMQNIFVQVLQQGCQLLQACATPDNGVARARDFVITRIGCFYELECQEWQKALYSIGGSEVKKWPLQLRRTTPDGMPTNSNGASLQQQEIERSLPSSPNPMYSPHSKSTGFMKTTGRKQLIGGPAVDGSRGSLQLVQSISFISVSVDHSLHLVSQADVSTGSSQGSGVTGSLNYLEGFTPVRSLGSTSASYILIPSPSMHFLTPFPLQLPTCLTSESPPLAHLLHSKGYAIPLSTGFVVSKAVPTLKKDINKLKEEWPSVLSVSLVDFYGGCGVPTEKLGRSLPKQAGRGIVSDAREYELEIHSILESVMAELHGLSWLTVSPAYLERRTALPFHCDMVLRLRRLLYFAEKEISGPPERPQL